MLLPSQGVETVWIVDDDEGMRRSLRLMFIQAGFRVRAYPGATEFLDEFERGVADCLILDLDMPEVDGLTLAKRLRDQGADLPIIMLSGHGTIRSAVRAMQLGAMDFLEKPADPEALIRRVADTLRRDAADRERRQEAEQVRRRLDLLTPRERELLELIVEGLANKQIALRLNIAEKTVANHRARLMEKMGAVNAADLARMVVEAGVQAGGGP